MINNRKISVPKDHPVFCYFKVSVSGFDDSVVWGVNSDQKISRRVGNRWKRVAGFLVVVSCGEAGVWGVNKGRDIFFWR